MLHGHTEIISFVKPKLCMHECLAYEKCAEYSIRLTFAHEAANSVHTHLVTPSIANVTLIKVFTLEIYNSVSSWAVTLVPSWEIRAEVLTASIVHIASTLINVNALVVTY